MPGGLVVTTLNPNAPVKFFLIVPELSPLSAQAKSMAKVSFFLGKDLGIIMLLQLLCLAPRRKV